jgi:hypothetical protein
MANRVKDFIESIIYAGMKPAGRSSEDAPAAQPGWFARWLNGPAQSDPLYLTNQTFGQKVRRMLILLSPVVVVIAGGILAMVLFAPKTTKVRKPLTAAEVRAKVLPEFNQPIKLDSNPDLEVTEVHFEHAGGNIMVGNLHNKSTHRIIQAIIVFELADPSNSELGGVTVTETDLAPGTTRTFKKPIEQSNAMYALVREVETR